MTGHEVRGRQAGSLRPSDLFLDASGKVRDRLPVSCDARVYGVGIDAQFVVSTPSVVSCGIAPVSVSNVLRAIVGE